MDSSAATMNHRTRALFLCKEQGICELHGLCDGVLRVVEQDFLQGTDGYLSTRKIEEKPVRLSVKALVGVSCNKPITSYVKSDARSSVAHLLGRGNRTGTVRRRMNSSRAVVGFGLMETDVQQRKRSM